MDVDPLSPIDLRSCMCEKLSEHVERLQKLVAQLIDPGPCSYDHHGYCQAHHLHPAPCPHEQAKALGIEPE